MPRTFEMEVTWLDSPTDGLIRAGVRRVDRDPISVRAGQFFMMHFERDGKKTNRSYSIANAVDGPMETIEFCIALVPDGVGSDLVARWDVGTRFDATGPHGRFILRDSDHDLVLVGTGTGIAPYASMYHQIVERLENGASVDLVQGVRSIDELVYRETFLALDEKYDEFSYHACFSKTVPETLGASVYDGRVQRALTSIGPVDATYFLCGNPEMVKDVRALLGERGVDRSHIRTESYTSPG